MVGDIVEAKFPHTDLESFTVRPAIVVAYVEMNDWILCQVTSARQRRSGDVRIVQSDMQLGRLAVESWARPNRLHALNESVINRTFGRLTDAKLAEILAAVRSLF